MVHVNCMCSLIPKPYPPPKKKVQSAHFLISRDGPYPPTYPDEGPTQSAVKKSHNRTLPGHKQIYLGLIGLIWPMLDRALIKARTEASRAADGPADTMPCRPKSRRIDRM